MTSLDVKRYLNYYGYEIRDMVMVIPITFFSLIWMRKTTVMVTIVWTTSWVSSFLRCKKKERKKKKKKKENNNRIVTGNEAKDEYCISFLQRKAGNEGVSIVFLLHVRKLNVWVLFLWDPFLFLSACLFYTLFPIYSFLLESLPSLQRHHLDDDGLRDDAMTFRLLLRWYSKGVCLFVYSQVFFGVCLNRQQHFYAMIVRMKMRSRK